MGHQDWTNTKQHFGDAYKNLLISGRGLGVPGTIVNAQALSDEEDDSINTITDIMSNVQYQTQGYTMSLRRARKSLLPSNSRPDQA